MDFFISNFSTMKGKRILLGITGSIAAYKSAFLVRLLIKAGAEVKVVMSESAKDFWATRSDNCGRRDSFTQLKRTCD